MKIYFEEGTDLSSIIGVSKYDPQAEFERKEADRLASIDKNRMNKFLKRYSWYRKLIFKPTRTPIPSFIRKTDEDRIQLYPDYYERWGHLKFTITEKVDGQSATYFCILNPKKGLFRKKWLFGVCSRNFQILKPDNSSYWTLAKKLDLENKMETWCNIKDSGFIIQGEAVGAGIQGNKYNKKGVELFVFNVAEYNKGRTINYNQEEQLRFCDLFNLKAVSVLELEEDLLPTIPEMVEYAKGCSLEANMPREGIVVRNYENNVSFKVVNTDFLLKYQE
jgi:RNA ligase (TIGR02306 family)